MLSLTEMIMVRRGEHRPFACRWIAKGEEYRTGVYTLAILRGEHPDEPELALFDHLDVETTESGSEVTLGLTAEQIAAAQGPARPEIERLVYRLRHDGADIYSGLLAIFPKSNQIEAPRKVAGAKFGPGSRDKKAKAGQ